VEQRFAPVYARVCDGPCVTRLVPGTYRLALAKGDRLVPVPEAAVIAGPSIVSAEYVDRSVVRDAGTVVGVAGVAGGLAMIIASAHSQQVCDLRGFCTWLRSFDGPLLAAGVAVLAGTLIVGSLLLSERDEARITVEPLAPMAPLSDRGSLAPTGALTAAVHGAGIALHF
jgi:hypothetical protein